MKRAPLMVIFVTVFLDLVGFGIIIPLLPRYAESFHAGGLAIGALAASYSLMQFIFNPLWGRLSDRIGRRPVLLFSLAGFVISYAMLGWAPSLAWLFAARILAGISGANIATAQAYIADLTTPEKRAQGMGLIGMAFGLGFTLGPALSAFLVGRDAAHPRYDLICFAAGGMSLLALLTALFALPESLDKNRAPAARPKFSWGALVKAFAHPRLKTLFLLFFITSFAFANMESTFSLFLEHRFALGPRAAGYFFVLIGVIIAAMQGGMVRILVPRFGEIAVLRAGIFTMTSGMLGLALANSIATVAVAIALVAVGNGLLGPAVFSTLSRAADPGEQGGAFGIAQGLSALGRVFGPLAGNLVFFGWPAGGGLAAIIADLGHHEGAPRFITGPYYTAAAFMALAFIAAVIGLDRGMLKERMKDEG